MVTTGVVNTVLDTAKKLVKSVVGFEKNVRIANTYARNNSLSEATKLTRVEPITIVSKDLLNNPETKVVLNSLLSIFTGYYLQAVDILTKISDIEVVRILDKLNPDRDDTGLMMQLHQKYGFSKESFKLISTEGYRYRLPTFSRPSLESNGQAKMDNSDQKRMEYFEKEKSIRENMKTASHQDKIKLTDDLAALKAEQKMFEDNVDPGHIQKEKEFAYKKKEHLEKGSSLDLERIDLDTMVNLSVGRLINVKIAYTKQDGLNKGDNRYVTIPVSVRLLVSSIPNESIARIMSYKNQDLSMIERIHAARSGRIEFIRDLVFCQDLIDEYKKAAIQDPTGILNELAHRANKAKALGLMTQNPSLVSASSLFVISDTVLREVESKLGGKLDNPRIREKAFENTYAMIIGVVSEEWETVTFYTRGISRSTSFGFKELESKVKGSGPDIGDIMKAMAAGQPPSF